VALAQLQAALARLFTDANLVEAFCREPGTTARRLGLTAKDAEIFAALDAAAVRNFASALTRKRVLDARKTLPLTYRALGPEFDSLLAAEIAEPSQPERRGADAALLADRLAARAAQGTVAPAWIGDLARYEAAFLAFERPERGVAILSFRFPLKILIGALLSGERPGRIAPRRSFGLWLRLRKSSGLIHVLW